MKVIEPKVEQLTQGWTLKDIKKQIEKAGRTCYKSEDKITDDSCEEFVQRMINCGHTAMLEHGTVYFKFDIDKDETEDALWDVMHSPYTRYHLVGHEYYVTTNYRVIIEKNALDAISKFICMPDPDFHVFRWSYKITCDRGVSHELVRHRVFSFAQESTRYCNYSKDKFGNELTFIEPLVSVNSIDGTNLEDDNTSYYGWTRIMQEIENSYFNLLDHGWKPQDARAVLPNSLKTDIIMTGYSDDWVRFFDLRCAKNAHPEMQRVANLIKNDLYKDHE